MSILPHKREQGLLTGLFLYANMKKLTLSSEENNPLQYPLLLSTTSDFYLNYVTRGEYYEWQKSNAKPYLKPPYLCAFTKNQKVDVLSGLSIRKNDCQ